MNTQDAIGLVKEITLLVTALSSLIASIAALRTGQKARKAAAQAQETAEAAHAKAAEAAREQINFALKYAAQSRRNPVAPEVDRDDSPEGVRK